MFDGAATASAEGSRLPPGPWIQWVLNGAQGAPPRPSSSTPADAWAQMVIGVAPRGLYRHQRRLERKALRAAQRALTSGSDLEAVAGRLWLRSKRVSERLDLFITLFFALFDTDTSEGDQA